jgi:putative ABC transport system permease protein
MPTVDLETLTRDARYALRLLRRSPVFTLTSTLTLAVAIGINTAVFSIVDAVLLKPLPYPDPERLALVLRIARGAGGEDRESSVDGRTWEAVRDRAAASDRAVFSSWTRGVNLVATGPNGSDQARYVQQQRVGAGFFRVLGVSPLAGREFNPDEDRPGGSGVVLLSGELWQNLFGRDRSIVGRSIMLRGEAHTVIGVMPVGFRTGQPADLWTPLRPSTGGEGGGENYQILARIAGDASWARATADVARVGADLVRERPPTPGTTTEFSLAPLQERLAASLRQPLLILWSAVGVVLLVACVNIAGLLLARVTQRSRELATRMALGGGRRAILQQLLVEAAAIASIACAAGIALGYATLAGLRWLAQGALVISQPVDLDARAVAAAILLSAAASLVFGVVPGMLTARLTANQGLLGSGSRSVAGAAARWPRRILVTTQVALAVVLFVAAGLLVRTFGHLHALQPGFSSTSVLTASISLEDARYQSAGKVRQLFSATIDRLRQTPGIDRATVSLGLPYERLLNLGFRRLDDLSGGQPRVGTTSATYVTPDYFETLRIPLRRGRTFDTRDRASSAAVVVINEAFARTYLDGDDPLGLRIRIKGSDCEIVGVVGDVQLKPGWGDFGPLAPMPLAYFPVDQVNDAFLQLVHGWFSPTFIVHSSMRPADTAMAMRRSLDAIDPLLPFAEVRGMSEVQDAAIAQPRLMMVLLVGLAVAAVMLAAIGLHGLIATSVAERTREMGIRLALGSTFSQAVRTVAGQGVALAGVGIVIGLMLAGAVARMLRHFIWGVSETDPVTFGSVAALLLLVATAASILPALRILRLDPATTLRHDC